MLSIQEIIRIRDIAKQIIAFNNVQYSVPEIDNTKFKFVQNEKEILERELRKIVNNV